MAPPSTPPPSARPRGRRAFCPLCGHEQADRSVHDVSTPEAALCAGRCTAAWQALEALRTLESSSARVATRRALEWEAREEHAPTLSEILFLRWRIGDWQIAPEHVLGRLSAD